MPLCMINVLKVVVCSCYPDFIMGFRLLNNLKVIFKCCVSVDNISVIIFQNCIHCFQFINVDFVW